MDLRLSALFGSLFLAAACASTASAPTTTYAPSVSPAPYAALEERPLDLPQIDSGECPVSELNSVNPDFAPALGPGPVYPVGFDDTSTISIEIGGFATQAGWLGTKTLWVGSAEFRGLALVRGGRLDAPGQVGFGAATTPDTELRLDATAIYADGRTWLNNPSYTRLKEAGCYAFQVDTDAGSYMIVFRAVVVT
jgi:hypothetical protein